MALSSSWDICVLVLWRKCLCTLRTRLDCATRSARSESQSIVFVFSGMGMLYKAAFSESKSALKVIATISMRNRRTCSVLHSGGCACDGQRYLSSLSAMSVYSGGGHDGRACCSAHMFDGGT